MTADAGASWWLLLTDDHFAKCAKPSDGGHCDAVAVRPQSSSTFVRLIELKASPEKGTNLQRKFDRTGRTVQAALGKAGELRAELHVKPVPKSSKPYQFAVKIDGLKVRVDLFANGKPA